MIIDIMIWIIVCVIIWNIINTMHIIAIGNAVFKLNRKYNRLRYKLYKKNEKKN